MTPDNSSNPHFKLLLFNIFTEIDARPKINEKNEKADAKPVGKRHENTIKPSIANDQNTHLSNMLSILDKFVNVKGSPQHFRIRLKKFF